MAKKTVDQELYQRISVNELILFAIQSLRERGEKCSFEELVKECFSFFPECFSFPGIKKWPDSRKLDRPLRTIRKRKLIVGEPKTSFSLTKLGKKAAEDVAKILRQGKLKI